jgi:hypothetical protein
VRRALDELEQDRRSMVAALHANGNIAGDDLSSALTAMDEQFNRTREKISMGADYADSEEEQFVTEKWWKK